MNSCTQSRNSNFRQVARTLIIIIKLILSTDVVHVTSVAQPKVSHCSVFKRPKTMFHTQFLDTFLAYLPTKFHAVTFYGSLVITTKLKVTVSLSLHYVVLQFTKKTRNRSCTFLENIMKLQDKFQYYV
jgi:hypothetical protein